jgi:antitoxin component YwqK of YwqJK toxin-antitoxin module
MRHFILFLAFSIGSLSAQEQKLITKEDSNTFKVVYLNEDGNISQQGFIKNNKLHGKWSSFNKTGIKIISGQYEKGKKVGLWIFRNDGKIKEVEYSDNIIVNVVHWDEPVTIATVND